MEPVSISQLKQFFKNENQYVPDLLAIRAMNGLTMVICTPAPDAFHARIGERASANFQHCDN